MYISNIVRLDLIQTKVSVLTYQHDKTDGGNLKIGIIETCYVATVSLEVRGHLPNFAYLVYSHFPIVESY